MKNNKKLIITRHGKTSKKYDVEDIDRPLKGRGINDSGLMAERLYIRGINPELFISSHANRALHTAMIFARKFDYPLKDINVNNMIYDGSAKEILDYIKTLDDSLKTVIIFGHNPMCMDMANFFMEEKLDKLPTAGIVALEFNTNSWKKIDTENASTDFIDYPKKGFDQ
ncbi:MAG: histidine phosphatase family protein [Bacteroidales bacterium]